MCYRYFRPFGIVLFRWRDVTWQMVLNVFHYIDHSGSLRRRLEAWRKPVLVKGPLGIVSAIELAFCLKFLALLIWAFSNYVSVGLANLKAEGAES